MEKIDKKIAEFESKIIQMQQELQGLKDSRCCESDLYEQFKDGDWIYVRGLTKSNVIKFKSHNLNNNLLRSYLSIRKREDKTCVCEENGVFDTIGSPNEIRLATNEEIQDAMVKIAEDKGFVRGVKFKGVTSDTDSVGAIITLGEMTYDNGKLHQWGANYSGVIYVDGKWAEIIKDFEIIPGYPVEYIDNVYCKVHARRFSKTDIQELIAALKQINHDPFLTKDIVKSINVGCSGQYAITIQELQDLLDNWKYESLNIEK